MAFSFIILPSIIIALIGIRVIIDWNKLRKAPGPFLAGFTDLWRAYQQYNGTMRDRLLDLHAQHGPIVRYGVRCVSISDPEVIKVVYGSRAGFISADSYEVLRGHQNGKEIRTLLSTRDEKQHGALRRSVANAFTSAAALDYEKWIDVTIGDLLESLTKKPKFDLVSMIVWYSMDAAARFSFSEPLGCLAAEGDIGGTIQMIRNHLEHWTRWASYPWIERLVHRNPILSPTVRSPSSVAVAATARLKERTSGAGVSKEGKEVDVAPDLLERFLEARKEYPSLSGPGIIGVLVSTIAAAGDTTAVTIAATLFYLLKNPEILKKLETELTDASIHEVPAFAEVSKLPYLNAVIKESMRVFPVTSFPMERLVPAGGAEIAGMYFPEGTTVGCLPAAIHLNKDIFGEDVDVFRPERWLISDREQLRIMEAAHMGFSRGKRNCIGQNIAMLSMKKVIPALINKFKLTLVDPEASLKADYTPNVALLEPIYVKSEIKS
ncbi:cytochrome P450 [Xylaria digitata]|nr:cytochrome P450 [Xylaria digitata]